MTTSTSVESERILLPWTDPQFRENPYPWYARLQRDEPVYLLDDTYIVSRYEDVVKYAKVPLMSVEPGWAAAGPWTVVSETILGVDPPRHTALRRQTNKWFTPKVVKEWVQVTSEVTAQALGRIGADGVVEAWHELAVLPTHTTMCRVLQLPEDDVQPVVNAMFDAMLMLSSQPAADDVDKAAAAFGYLSDRIAKMLADKRANPGDGLADALIAAQERGEITEGEAIATITTFFALGHMDSGYLVASGLEQFARRPEVFDAYKQNPESRQAIINEMVRLDPPELSFVRYPTEDIEIRGVQIPAGSPIRFMIGAANRDPDVFENPDDFDFRRPPEASRNLSFGIGIHSCAGQVISRGEAEAIFTEIADRYERIELAGPVEIAHNDFARFYKRLPLRLT